MRAAALVLAVALVSPAAVAQTTGPLPVPAGPPVASVPLTGVEAQGLDLCRRSIQNVCAAARPGRERVVCTIARGERVDEACLFFMSHMLDKMLTAVPGGSGGEVDPRYWTNTAPDGQPTPQPAFTPPSAPPRR